MKGTACEYFTTCWASLNLLMECSRTSCTQLFDLVDQSSLLLDSYSAPPTGALGAWPSFVHTRLSITFIVGFSLSLALVIWNLLCTASAFKVASLAAANTTRGLDEKAPPVGPVLADSGYGHHVQALGTFDHPSSSHYPGSHYRTAYLLNHSSGLPESPSQFKLGHSVFFIGLIISTSVLQLYISGLFFTLLLGILCLPWFYQWFLPNCWLYIGEEAY